MRSLVGLFTTSTVLVLFLGACGFSAKKDAARDPAANVDRPPQFVLLAFDGSKSLDMWKETREFARQENIQFTYFISGVYFIPQSQRSEYKGPGVRAGRSDIGFADSENDIRRRLDHMVAALGEGHEMASHANGHFDGSKWTTEQWSSEFAQFDKFLLEAWQKAKGKEPKWWEEYFTFIRIGFRAPVLGHSAGLWKTLKNFNFQYDTSKVSASNYWPKKENGVWNFPLASIRRHGTKYSTLSMDYNFYYSHSKGKKGPEAQFGSYEREMYNSYLQYFKQNYLGNRAPVHIGHHFSLWNGGAYWRAMRKFAKAVCHLPEVRCVTYAELLKYVQKESDRLSGFQSGNFNKMTLAEAERYLGADLQKVSYVDDAPMDDSELQKFLEVLKTHSPEAAE